MKLTGVSEMKTRIWMATAALALMLSGCDAKEDGDNGAAVQQSGSPNLNPATARNLAHKWMGCATIFSILAAYNINLDQTAAAQDAMTVYKMQYNMAKYLLVEGGMSENESKEYIKANSSLMPEFKYYQQNYLSANMNQFQEVRDSCIAETSSALKGESSDDAVRYISSNYDIRAEP
jgi:hypothetical protein